MITKRILLVVVILTIIVCSNSSFSTVNGEGFEADGYLSQVEIAAPVRAKVLEVLDHQTEEIEYSGGVFVTETKILLIEVTQGPYKNQIVEALYQINTFSSVYNIDIKKGDGVLVYIESDSQGQIVDTYIVELLRENYLFYLFFAFIILLIVIGRTKGLKAIISLGLTCFAVIKILLPAILNGNDPITITILTCIALIAVNLIIISGINKKTFAAIIGTSGGLMTAGVITLVVGTAARLTGMGNEEAHMLIYVSQDITINFQGLLFAAILIGALGAVMDIGISVASSMYEIELTKPDISKKNLIRSGLNVGKDVMATMSNTLILAYAGGSIHLMLLLMIQGIPFMEIVNSDYMASEVVRALAGSIGLIVTIPVTALAMAVLSKNKNTGNAI